jgi:hypothetical protein
MCANIILLMGCIEKMYFKTLLRTLFLFVGCITFPSSFADSVIEVVQAKPVYCNGTTCPFMTIDEAIADSIHNCNSHGYFGCAEQYVGESLDSSRAWFNYKTITTFSVRDSKGVVQTFTGSGGGHIYFDCPDGFSVWLGASSAETTCIRKDPRLSPCFLCGMQAAKVGNPIYTAGGVKQQVEVDYQNSDGTLKFVRTYRSDMGKWEHNYSIFAVDMNDKNSLSSDNSCYMGVAFMSQSWYCYEYTSRRRENDFLLRRGNGRLIYFGTANDLSPVNDVNDRLSVVLNEAGQRVGVRVVNGESDAIEEYSLQGKLIASTARNGAVTHYKYSDSTTPEAVAPRPGLLIEVGDDFAHKILFTYSSDGLMRAMIDPSGGVYSYFYSAGILEKVIYPDGSSKRYIYGEPDKTGGLFQPYLLTGIFDENNVRFATYSYEKGYSGRASSTEHAGGVEKFTATYSAYDTTVTDPLGTQKTYGHVVIVGVDRATGTNQPRAVSGGGV